MTALSRALQQRTLKWLEKRIPASQRFALDLKSVFIFPSLFGWGFIVVCGSLFILGTNYQNNLMLLLCYFLLSLMLITLFVSYKNFAKLHVRALPVTPVYAGNHASLTLQCQQPGKPQLSDGLFTVTWWQQDDGITCELAEHSGHLTLPYFTSKRGVYPLPRVTLSNEYPLGLFRCWTHLDFNQTLVVYPTPIPCKIAFQEEGHDEGSNTTEQAGHDDFFALRSYIPGEPVHRVAWKHVAKGGDWVSKEFSQQQAKMGYLSLPATDDLETALSKLAFQVSTLSEQRIAFGLKLGRQTIEPDSGDNHKHRCLTALARYAPVGAIA